MRTIRYQIRFKKDIKRLKKSGRYDMSLLEDVLNKLLSGETLPEKYHDHDLSGNWKGFRECHIAPDWLLVYTYEEEGLVLVAVRTGSHSEVLDNMK